MYARPFIDSLDFATNGKQLDAKVPVAELLRLLEALESPQGFLHYSVKGGLDNQERPVLDISIDGSIQLRCQRCLKGMDYAVQQESRLLLCDQAALDVLDDQEEEFDGILADAHLDVLDLLEEEILLGLPISPMHGDCQADEGEDKLKGKRNPFAVLENLKRN